jgi:hypothetical protein
MLSAFTAKSSLIFAVFGGYFTHHHNIIHNAAISSNSAKFLTPYSIFCWFFKKSIVRLHDTVAAASSYLGVVLKNHD